MRTAGGSDVEVPVLSDKKLVVNRTRATFAKRWLWIVPGIVENGLKPQMAKLGAATLRTATLPSVLQPLAPAKFASASKLQHDEP